MSRACLFFSFLLCDQTKQAGGGGVTTMSRELVKTNNGEYRTDKKQTAADKVKRVEDLLAEKK